MNQMNPINFCHISPTQYLHLVKNRDTHLVLAHLIEKDLNGETDGSYTEFYRNESHRGATIIVDNSMFEYYKQGKPPLDSSKLIDLGRAVNGDFIVLSDYPDQPGQVTINKAEELIPEVKAAGFRTFFVPQSKIGDIEDYIKTFEYGINHPEIDLVGVSILGVPNAYGVERNNNLQRYLSRYTMLGTLKKRGILTDQYKKLHFLGMVDGPNEIELVKDFHDFIWSWDSSSAVWAGIQGVEYDNSPTGLLNGKIETEVDFEIPFDESKTRAILNNMARIDNLVQKNTKRN